MEFVADAMHIVRGAKMSMWSNLAHVEQFGSFSCDTNVVFQGYIPRLTGCGTGKVKVLTTYLGK